MYYNFIIGDFMKKNKKNKIIKVIVILLIIIIICLSALFLYKKFNKKENVEVKNVVNKLNEIDGYGITLSDNDSALYKEEYEKLKNNLESKNIDFDEYASSIAKLFIIDLYTINNKINKYDVGSVEFVYPDNIDNYKLNVESTIYKYVKDNSNDDRKQSLPEVKSVSIDSTKKSKYKIKSENKEYQSYIFKISWKYVKDLDYDDNGEVIVINKDNKMYVVEKN